MTERRHWINKRQKRVANVRVGNSIYGHYSQRDLEAIAREIVKYKVTVLMLQETRWEGNT